MMPLPSLWPWALVAIASAVGGYAVAAKVGAGETARAEARRIECERARERDARAAAEAAARLLARAQDAEGAAAAKLAAARAAQEAKLKETRHEIHRLAAGRECLSGALRLRLNAAIDAADGLPARAGDADPAVAAAADDTGVAQWIIDAAGRYDDCRARIDALRQWDAVTFGSAP